MTDYKSIKYNISGADLTNIPTSAITSGTFADARISASSVTAHVSATDLTPVRLDILTLGLKQGIQENSTKFNLPNSAICTFEADADFNLAGSTDTTRNASEYIWAAGTTTTQATVSKTGSPTHSTAYAKWGTSSLYTGTTASDYIHWDTGADHMVLGTSDWTFEYWYYIGSNNTWLPTWAGTVNSDLSQSNSTFIDVYTAANANDLYGRVGGDNVTNQTAYSPHNYVFSTGTWHHVALVRDGTDFEYYVGGTRRATHDLGSGAMGDMRYGWLGKSTHTNYWDDFRISDTARYTGSSYTIPASRFSSDSNTKFLLQSINQTNGTSTFVDTGAGSTTISASATGTALGTTNVPTSAVTDVSGVLLMKNSSGTNTLGTDVKVYFTADNSNWTEVTDYSDAGTFSDTTKMIKLGKKTCTSGSDVRWKVVWANQSAGSKVAHIFGIGLNY